MEEIERVKIDPKGGDKKGENKYESLKSMRDTLNGYRDQALGAFYMGCDQTGLSRKLTEEALRNTDKSNMESSSDETLKEFLNAIKSVNGKNNDFYDGEEGLTSFREMILNLKDLIDQVIECENQLHTINEAIREVEIAITSKIFSNSFIKKRIDDVNNLEANLRKKLENNEFKTVEESVAARKDLSQCDALRKTYDLSFVTDDIDYDKLIDTFMRRMSNDYCFKKCSMVLHKMNLSVASFNSFANLEETHLDKKYHQFNNFFLFHIIRLIGYMDPDNKVDSLRAKTLIHGLVGFVSAPDNCECVRNLIDKFYQPIMERMSNGDENVIRLAEANPYTTRNAEEIDKEIVETVSSKERENLISYIKRMILVDGSASSKEDVDNFLAIASDEDLFNLREKISLLVKLEKFDPRSMSITGISFTDLNTLKEQYEKLNEAYENSIKK